MTVYQSVTELIGKTPLLQLNQIAKEYHLQGELLVKLECFNPNHSVKDRTAWALIEAAEKSGKLRPGQRIVEVTSGNTGIGLAAIAAAKGYPLTIYIQDGVSEERFKIIKAFGAELKPISEEPAIIDALEASGGSLVAAMKYLNDQVFAKDDRFFFTDQFASEANRNVHYETTGAEIWEDTQGEVAFFAAAVGTGGTISGVGRYLKAQNPDVQIVAVHPGAASLPSAENPDPEQITGIHPFLDLPSEWLPENFDRGIYDETLFAETSQAYEVIRQVARLEGLLLGVSAGAVIHSGIKLAQRPENKGKKIVVIAPDTGLNYLSTGAFS